MHASATPGGGPTRVTEHRVGERGVKSIHLNTFGVVVFVDSEPPVFIPASNVRWGEIAELPKLAEPEPPAFKAVEGGKGKRR